ncbi:MAG TPA: helix-hairpin-helix domain-containing protein [Polyangiaceae bacterium]|nr:helix-hairpin-helix domain-containing protein [Polyangiaceae bacterium]
MDARHTSVEPHGTSGEQMAPALVGGELGGGLAAPTGTPSVANAGKNPWAKVVGKGAALFAGMLGLAAIGAWSEVAGAGVPVPLPPRPSADRNGVWLAGPSPSGAPSAAPSPSSAASAPSPAPSPDGASPPGPPSGVTADGRVVLNTATLEDLQKLPRIGRKRAEAILELRRKLGKFRKATELLRVRGIGPKGLRLMLPKLVVDPP